MSVGSGVRGSPQPRLYAVSVGHFTHFAFTVNFTHYVKTKPASGFTVKSRTLTTHQYSRGQKALAHPLRLIQGCNYWVTGFMPTIRRLSSTEDFVHACSRLDPRHAMQKWKLTEGSHRVSAETAPPCGGGSSRRARCS